ncbi:MAG: E3 binding domain-containing protein, partial [Methylobacterium sp.]|uniref:biotin/lipoyl-containing protein n=1 Tax=Methylobacterium sp. TaxID=409 RepID=UPI0025855D5A
MPINVLMPALSPTMEKGNLAKWLKKEGDTVKAGDVLAEIETDKATMEVEAVDEGVLARIVVPEGTADVPVNDLIALIAGEGEDPKSVGAGGGAEPEASKPQSSKPEVGTDAADRTPGGGTMAYARVNEAPDAAKPAATPERKPNGAASPAPGGRIFASPLARRIAKQEGIDLSGVTGSGPHGRVIERDVRAALKEGGATASAPAPQAPAASPPDAPADK